jgi:hypothetical protein
MGIFGGILSVSIGNLISGAIASLSWIYRRSLDAWLATQTTA